MSSLFLPWSLFAISNLCTVHCTVIDNFPLCPSQPSSCYSSRAIFYADISCYARIINLFFVSFVLPSVSSLFPSLLKLLMTAHLEKCLSVRGRNILHVCKTTSFKSFTICILYKIKYKIYFYSFFKKYFFA